MALLIGHELLISSTMHLQAVCQMLAFFCFFETVQYVNRDVMFSALRFELPKSLAVTPSSAAFDGPEPLPSCLTDFS